MSAQASQHRSRLQIDESCAEFLPTGSRVTWLLNGQPIWFESADADLHGSAEAILCALTPVAAKMELTLECAQPVDPCFHANLGKAIAVIERWWGDRADVLVPRARASTDASETGDESKPVGLFFSGGVDSFHSLLRPSTPPSVLVYVHGFDISLDDRVRMDAWASHLKQVAEAVGARLIVVRTNLRLHALVQKTEWGERLHGGALACVAHLLRRHISVIQISASYPLAFNQPWGSHWEIDPFWSSSYLQVAHVGHQLWRTQKLLDICGEPLVRRHLRVCWENRSETGNCGQCEKCIRTMLILVRAGCLDEFPIFPSRAEIVNRINALKQVRPDEIVVYRAFLEGALPERIADAVRGLIARSQAFHGVAVS